MGEAFKKLVDGLVEFYFEFWHPYLRTFARFDFFAILVVTLGFAYVSMNLESFGLSGDRIGYLLPAIFTLCIGFLSGRLGVIFDKSLGKDESVMKQKGETSVRTLMSVLKKLERVRENIVENGSKLRRKEEIRLEYKGLGDIVDLIRFDIWNAARDWNDILPGIESFVQAQDLEINIQKLKETKKQLESTSEKFSNRKERLERVNEQIGKKVSRLKEIQIKLDSQESYSSLSSIAGATVYDPTKLPYVGYDGIVHYPASVQSFGTVVGADVPRDNTPISA